MGLKEQVFSVLVVSSAKNFNTAITDMLPKSEFSPIICADNIAGAKRTFAERRFDFVIINAPLNDDPGVRFAVDCASSKGAIVLLLVSGEIHAEVEEKVMPYGVFTLSKPMTVQSMRNALSWLKTAKTLTKRYEKKTTSIEDKMQEIRLVNKAKWLLISNENMEEPEAHRYIEKHAMDLCVTKRAVAEEIIKKYS